MEIIPEPKSVPERIFSGATTATSVSHTSPNSDDSDDEIESVTSSQMSKKKNKYTTYFPNKHYPPSVTSTTGESSVDQDGTTPRTTTTSNTSHDSHNNVPIENTNTIMGSIIQMGKKILNFQKMGQSAPHAYIAYRDEEDEEEEEEEALDVQPVVSREPYGFRANSARDNVLMNASFMKNQMHSELRDKMGNSLYVRSSNATPEPRPSRSTGLIDEPTRPAHKRNLTYSEGDFSPVKLHPMPAKPMRRISAFVCTPRMDACVRVQHHSIAGLRQLHQYSSVVNQDNLWTMDRVFDIFIHPSTLPEIYHYLGITNSEAFLVELLPISFEKSAFKFPDAGGVGSMSDLALAGSSSSDASAKSDSSLPHSVVVRMFFATSVIVEKESMYGVVSESLSLDDFHTAGGVAGSSDDDVDPPPFPWKVAVKEGHVVMSDLLRQQLEVHDCSRVRLMDVLDKWKIPATENINVSLYPVYPGKVSQVGVAVCICGTFIW